MVAASRNGLDDTPNTTRVILRVHCSVSSASGGPVNQKNLRASLSSSATQICRKALVMSAKNATGCSLTFIKTLRTSGFRFGPMRSQSLSEGKPSSCDEASNTTLNLVVTLSSLITAW